MSLSAGRIRSINRALAKTHAAAYTSRDRNPHCSPTNLPSSSSVIPPHTIKIVAVPKPIYA